jgi:hypothetical protein
MNEIRYSDETINLKIMAYLDQELSAEESAGIAQLIAKNPHYQKRYHQLLKLKEVTGAMKFKILPDMYWDEYWQHVYNRIERGISWILISVGAVIILSFALWTAVTKLLADQALSPFLKFGILALIIGTVILFISIVREKLMVRRIDKYKEVER